MKRSAITAVFLLTSLAVYADYTPDDTYLVCGNALVSIETDWKQRIENRNRDNQDSRGADVSFDVELLLDGVRAEHLKAVHEGVAHKDHIYLYGKVYWFKLTRTNPTLHVSHAVTPSTSFKVFKSLPCDIVSETQLTDLVDSHNEGIQGVKF